MHSYCTKNTFIGKKSETSAHARVSPHFPSTSDGAHGAAGYARGGRQQPQSGLAVLVRPRGWAAKPSFPRPVPWATTPSSTWDSARRERKVRLATCSLSCAQCPLPRGETPLTSANGRCSLVFFVVVPFVSSSAQLACPAGQALPARAAQRRPRGRARTRGFALFFFFFFFLSWIV